MKQNLCFTVYVCTLYRKPVFFAKYFSVFHSSAALSTHKHLKWVVLPIMLWKRRILFCCLPDQYQFPLCSGNPQRCLLPQTQTKHRGKLQSKCSKCKNNCRSTDLGNCRFYCALRWLSARNFLTVTANRSCASMFGRACF